MLLAILLVLAGTGDEPAAPSASNVVAKIADEEVTRAEFAEWLLDAQGAVALPQFLEARLLDRAARDRGCVVSDAEVDSAFQTEWNTVVKLRFGGNEARFLEELASGGQTRDSYSRQRSIAIRAELTLDRLSQRDRDVSERALRAKFESDYGSPPTRLSVRVIQISKFALEQEAIRSGKPRSNSTTEMESKAESLAKDILARAEEGAEFEMLARDFSHDLESRTNGGLIPHLTVERLGLSVWTTARSLTEQRPLSGLVKDGGGFTIVKLEARTPVAFEDVARDLESAILAAPVSGTERGETLTRLRSQYPIEILFR